MLTILVLGLLLGVIRRRTSTTVAIAVHALYDIARGAGDAAGGLSPRRLSSSVSPGRSATTSAVDAQLLQLLAQHLGRAGERRERAVVGRHDPLAA